MLEVWPFVCDIHKITVLVSHTFIAKQYEIITVKDV